MFSNKGHISDIYTKPLTIELPKINEEDSDENEPKTKTSSTKKNTPFIKNKYTNSTKNEPAPKINDTFQIIEDDIKLRNKRRTPGKKGLLVYTKISFSVV